MALHKRHNLHVVQAGSCPFSRLLVGGQIKPLLFCAVSRAAAVTILFMLVGSLDVILEYGLD